MFWWGNSRASFVDAKGALASWQHQLKQVGTYNRSYMTDEEYKRLQAMRNRLEIVWKELDQVGHDFLQLRADIESRVATEEKARKK
jgi:hypothetical protein